MSKGRRAMVKCFSVQDDLDDNGKRQENLSVASKDTIMQIDTNVESHGGYDGRTFGHSTPVRAKSYTNDMEGSPEIDYRCSPILIPLTQDTNEVAWDWHSSTNKPDKKETCKNSNVDTPKRTKLLQKRNSNSPLLYKPHKRKLVKLENIESIGKFAAELQAITEQMKSIKRNDEKFSNERVDYKNEINTALFTECDVQDSIEKDARITLKDESIADTCPLNKIGSSFDDLFDDSINDSMIRCSQEIEAKFSTDTRRKNNTPELSTVSEETELLMKAENDMRYVTLGNSSSDNSKVSRMSESSLTSNRVNYTKTYSRTASSVELNSSSQNTKFKKDGGRQSCFNNNVHNENSSSLKSSSAELFEIPDDSFDDCLATCMESDAVLSKSSKHDNVFPELDQNVTYGEGNYKNTPSTLQGKVTTSNSIAKSSTVPHQPKVNNYTNNGKSGSINASTYPKTYNTGSSLSSKNAIKTEGSPSTFRENRKFFKTKSLSDSYFDHGQTISVNNKVNVKDSVDNVFCSSPNSNSQPKKQGNINARTNNLLASAHLPQGISAPEDKKLSLPNSMHNACTLNFNRCTGQGGGSHITRHHSLTSLNTDTKDSSKGTQATLCTPAEIERKRLEAKMRLEAKRKQQMSVKFASVTGSFTRGSVKR